MILKDTHQENETDLYIQQKKDVWCLLNKGKALTVLLNVECKEPCVKNAGPGVLF